MTDPYIEGFKKSNAFHETVTTKDVVIALIILGLFLTLTMVLPCFDFFEQMALFPENMNVLTLYTINAFVLTIFTMFYFGRRVFTNAVRNYYNYKTMNMETLIAIGCISSILMTIFLISIYLLNTSSSHTSSSSFLSSDDRHKR